MSRNSTTSRIGRLIETSTSALSFLYLGFLIVRISIASHCVRTRQSSFKYRHFAVALAIALGIEFLLLPTVRKFALVDSIEQSAVDWVINLYQGEPSTQNQNVRFALIDIDDESYWYWDEPAAIPHAKLAKLIDFAASNHPRLIIIDVDLTHRQNDGAAQLTQSLFSASRPTSGSTGIPIVISRPLVYVTTATQEPIAYLAHSFLESSMATNSNIYWAAFTFERDADWIVRRWKSKNYGCNEGALWEIPSIPVVAREVINQSSVPVAKKKRKLSPEVCSTPAALRNYFLVERGSARQDPELTNLRIDAEDLVESDLSRRIVYTLPWKPRYEFALPYIPHQVSLAPIVIPMSAHRILSDATPVSGKPIEDAVVIIGGSYSAGRDVHPTPIGPMPGSWIIMNAIRSLIEFGPLRHPSESVHVRLSLITCLVVAAVFSLMRPLAASIVGGLLVFVLAITSILWLRSGIWLSFVLPLIGLQVHSGFEVAKHEFAFQRQRARSALNRRQQRKTGRYAG